MRPLLLLHPLGSDAHFWDFLLAGQPLARELVAVDLPGHGARALPKVGDGVAGLARAVVADLDRLGIERCDVVGISLGGLVAQHLLAHHADRFALAALVDTVVRYPDPMRQMWRDRAALVRSQGMAAVVQATLDIWFTPQFLSTAPDVLDEVTETLLATDTEGYARTCEILAAADLSVELARISAPTIVMCGTDDGPAFRESASAHLARLAHDGVTWLPGKHVPMVENPGPFIEALRAFLDQDTHHPDLQEQP